MCDESHLVFTSAGRLARYRLNSARVPPSCPGIRRRSPRRTIRRHHDRPCRWAAGRSFRVVSRTVRQRRVRALRRCSRDGASPVADLGDSRRMARAAGGSHPAGVACGGAALGDSGRPREPAARFRLVGPDPAAGRRQRRAHEPSRRSGTTAVCLWAARRRGVDGGTVRLAAPLSLRHHGARRRRHRG